jgi:cytochrome c-type biogenesis protein CcmH/NrfG
LRQSGDLAAAQIEAERARAADPDLPEAQFELAAALAESGDAAQARTLWLALIEAHPNSDLAPIARRNLQAFSAAEPAPIPPPPGQPGPRPRPAAAPRG